MSSHTPGPWTMVGPDIDEGYDFAIVADGKIIAECFGRIGINTHAPSEANAYLIAAAPILLEAAKAALDWFHAYARYWEYSCAPDGEGIATELDAAIAAADPDFVC